MKLTTIILLLALTACAPYVHPVCRHRAVFAAITAGELAPVRIARGVMPGGVYHVQAEILLDGKWRPLKVMGGDVWLSPRDDFTVIEYWDVTDYFLSRFENE